MLQRVLAQVPAIDPKRVEDVIVGCAMPEYEQGMNVARIGLLLAGLPNSVAGMTINRFCSSGLNAVSIAADRIRTGEADIMIAAGTESMSMIPMLGRLAMNEAVFASGENVGHRLRHGDHRRERRHAVEDFARGAGCVRARVAPEGAGGAGQRRVRRRDQRDHRAREPARPGRRTRSSPSSREIARDEGPRADTSAEGLAKLRPVFAAKGSVTAGNSSQMSDGAGASILVSERVLKELNLAPLARWVGFAVGGVPPEIMGVGPIAAIPKVLKSTGLTQDQIDWIELNEAFAAQALAVIKELGIDPAKVNPLGGAIALGHPLGATGAIRTATITHGLQAPQAEVRHGHDVRRHGNGRRGDLRIDVSGTQGFGVTPPRRGGFQQAEECNHAQIRHRRRSRSCSPPARSPSRWPASRSTTRQPWPGRNWC